MDEQKLTYVWGQKSGVVFFFVVFVGYGSNGDG